MSASKGKKSFDCVEMKRQAQQRIFSETKALAPAEEIEYFRQRAQQFWQRIGKLGNAPREVRGPTRR